MVDLNFIDNESDSNSDFISFYNKLINESIKFDWQELKDNVDSSDDPEIIKAFYDKYYHFIDKFDKFDIKIVSVTIFSN